MCYWASDNPRHPKICIIHISMSLTVFLIPAVLQFQEDTILNCISMDMYNKFIILFDTLMEPTTIVAKGIEIICSS